MSKDAIDNFLNSTDTASSMQTGDLLQDYLSAPVTKLDADEYTASDLTATVESAAGTGNLNFLMMQAAQTNDAMGGAGLFTPIGTDNLFDAAGLSSPAASPFARRSDTGNSAADVVRGDNGFTALPDTENNGNANNAIGSAQATASDITTASEEITATISSAPQTPATPSVQPAQAANGINGINGADGTDGTAGANGLNGDGGADGSDGSDGADGDGGNGNTTITNNYYDNDTIINNGDTTIINNNNTNNTNNTTTLIDLSQTTTVVTTITNNVTNVNESNENILTVITENTFETINNIIDGGGGGDGLSLFPLGLDLSLNLTDALDLNLDAITGQGVTTIIDKTLDLPLVGDVLGAVGGDLLSSTNLNILFNPLTPDNGAGDTDLVVNTGLDALGLGLPPLVLDIPLDAVEALAGDIDINLSLVNDVLSLLGGDGGADGGTDGDTNLDLTTGLGLVDGILETPALDPVIDLVENIAGDLDIGGTLGLGLLGNGDTDAAGEPDITLPLEIDLVDIPLLGNTGAITLDAIESVVGDIDLDLGAAGNLLGDLAPGIFDGAAGGTDTGITDIVGDLAGGIASGLLGTDGDNADTDLALDLGLGTEGTAVTDTLTLILDPVEDLAGDLDIAPVLGLDLFGSGGTEAGDADLSAPLSLDLADQTLASGQIDLPLDIVEAVTGDIDLGLPIAGDILGDTADTLIDGITGGGADETLLSGAGDVLSEIGGGVTDGLLPAITYDIDLLDSSGSTDADDTDLSIPLEIDLVDSLLPGDGIELSLDPLESIAGDIDLELALPDIINDGPNGLLSAIDQTLDTAIDILGNAAPLPGGLDLDGILGGGEGGIIAPWTESVLPDAGSALGGGLDGGIGAIIADPVSTLSSATLPVIDNVLPIVNLGGGGGGGGGGGRLFGGLFG